MPTQSRGHGTHPLVWLIASAGINKATPVHPATRPRAGQDCRIGGKRAKRFVRVNTKAIRRGHAATPAYRPRIAMLPPRPFERSSGTRSGRHNVREAPDLRVLPRPKLASSSSMNSIAPAQESVRRSSSSTASDGGARQRGRHADRRAAAGGRAAARTRQKTSLSESS